MNSKTNKFILVGVLVGTIAGILAGVFLGADFQEFNIRLAEVPKSSVTYELSASENLKLSSASLTFDKKNWKQFQVVRIEYKGSKPEKAKIEKVNLAVETTDADYLKNKPKPISVEIDTDGEAKILLKFDPKRKSKTPIVALVKPPVFAFNWLATLFKNSLKILIIPLILFSLIAGITSLGDLRKMGSIGKATITYYLITTMLSVIIGIILVNIIQPGLATNNIDMNSITTPAKVNANLGFTVFETIEKLITGIVWPNIIDAMAKLKIMPVILFSLLLGGVLTTMGDKAKGAIETFQVLNSAILKIISWVLVISPFGVFALLAMKFGTSDLQDELFKILKYAMTVIVGLLIHAVIILPTILYFFGKRSPLQYFRGMIASLSTAFATASSSATLPITLECVEENNEVPNKVASFVLPLGATINMDGTALYEAVAAMFIAQIFGYDLTISQQIMIVLTANLAAIGAAGIPSAGLVTMIMVLQSVDLPVEGIGIIFAIDWFLDRWRTTVNVWGDAVGAAVIAKQVELPDEEPVAG